MLARLGLGLIISAAIGLFALRRGSLSPSGVLGAMLTGTSLFGFGGFTAGSLLIAFFVSSSALSKYKREEIKKRTAAQAFDKGGRRDIWQALANGGAAAALAGLFAWFDQQGDTRSAFMAYAGVIGALATANADTWATELGVLSRGEPRLITRPWQRVPRGTSGGVSGWGSWVALLGALFVCAVFALITFLDGLMFGLASEGVVIAQRYFTPLHLSWVGLALPGILVFVAAGTLGGWLGALADSVLGATLQATYFSAGRNQSTERTHDDDGSPNQFMRGLRIVNNDLVNFLATCIGAGISAWLVGLAPF